MSTEQYFEPSPGSTPSKILQAQLLEYRRRRLWLWRETRPKTPRFLFKYFGADPTSDATEDRVRDVLVRSRLWLSSPSAFNDPFDSKAITTVPKDINIVRKRFEKMVSNQEPDLTWKKRRDRVSQLMSTEKNLGPELIRTLNRTHQMVVSKMGVTCLSETAKSLLMWSHYGGHHKGLCFIFETVVDLPMWAQALPVIYTEEYPVVRWEDDDTNQNVRALLSKFTDWEYEKEWRIVALGGAEKFIRFNGDSLVGVVFGCNAGSDMTDMVLRLKREREAVGLNAFAMYRAVQDRSQYRLRLFREKFERNHVPTAPV